MAKGRTIYGTDVDDIIHGGAGNDTLDGAGGWDTLYGGRGDDRLFDGWGNDTLYGESGDDTAYLSSGRNTFRGGSGDDVVYDRDGRDTVIGGSGFDVIKFSSSPDTRHGVVLDLVSGMVTNDGFDHAETISGIEGAYDSLLADRFYGDKNDNLFSISLGDTVSGAGGDDYIIVGTMSDASVDGGTGQDTLELGAGYVDAANVFHKATHGVNVSLAEGLVLDDGHGIMAAIAGIESVTGDVFSDIITGSAAANTLRGMAGADTIIGGAGDDIIYGGVGNDSLSGGSGSDTFSYGAYYYGYDDIALSSEYGGVDTINDFEIATSSFSGDKIDLSEVALEFGAITFVGQEQTSSVGSLGFAFEDGMTIVTLNVDRDDAHDLTIRLAGEISLSASDFILS